MGKKSSTPPQAPSHPATVGLQSSQHKNDNRFVKYMSSKLKNTEQGLQQLCGSFFYVIYFEMDA